MSVFTKFGEVLESIKKDGEEGPKKFQLKTDRDIILPATTQSYKNKDGKVVTKDLPELRIKAGSYIKLLDPNRGSFKRPAFVKYDVTHVEPDKK